MPRPVLARAGIPAFLLLSAIARAQDPSAAPSAKRWTVDDVLALKGVSEVAISPDGRRVAYVIASRDLQANVNQSDIWMVSTDGGAARQVTQGPRADRAPQWAPDASWLAFLSDRGEGRRMQVYGIDPSGGEAWPITRHDIAVTSYKLSPNGQLVAFLAPAAPSRADQDLERERGRPIVRDSAYANEYTRLWTVTVAREAAESRPSSPDGFDVGSVVWAPDSRAIAFGAKPTPTLRSMASTAVYLQSEPGAEPRKLTTMPGAEQVVGWPNEPGLIVSASGEAFGTANDRLWLVPVTGTEPTPLTDALDENAGFVAANARELLVEASSRTGRGLFRIPLLNGKPAGPPQRASDERRFYSGYTVATGGGMVAFLAETASEPPDVFVSSMASFAPKRLTTVNPQTSAFGHGEQRIVTWKSAADSESIEGVLTLPVGFQTGTRVPLLLVIHGGPSGVSSARYPSRAGAYPAQVFTSLGYAVLQPNYRGSTGYGARFRGLNKGDISGRDWIDINSGVDAMVRQGIADSTKLGIMGWSFGGHHTYWGITHTPRFAAASAGAGANDLISMYSQTDIPEFYHTYLGPPPWENFDLYEQRSAYRFVKNVATPLLIQVGEADRRVPAEQSIQFYEAVRGQGKTPVKLVLYPGQPHGITDPRLTRDLMRRNVDWFSYWIPVTGPKPPMRVADRPE